MSPDGALSLPVIEVCLLERCLFRGISRTDPTSGADGRTAPYAVAGHRRRRGGGVDAGRGGVGRTAGLGEGVVVSEHVHPGARTRGRMARPNSVDAGTRSASERGSVHPWAWKLRRAPGR